jgi:hypothetical protein
MVDEAHDSDNLLDQADIASYVEVMFAKSLAEANLCCDYLGKQQIPARLESAAIVSRANGVAVLVPSDRFIEASELLASRLQGDIDDDSADEGLDELDDDADELDDDDDDDDFDDDDDEDELDDDEDADKDDDV